MRRPSRGSFVMTTLTLFAIMVGALVPVAARQDAASPVTTPVGSGGSDWPMYRQNPERTASVDGPALVGQPVELVQAPTSAWRAIGGPGPGNHDKGPARLPSLCRAESEECRSFSRSMVRLDTCFKKRSLRSGVDLSTDC